MGNTWVLSVGDFKGNLSELSAFIYWCQNMRLEIEFSLYINKMAKVSYC